MKKFFLITILILAAVFRLAFLADFPAGLNADEAALGYNAYSLMLTGRDEHGHTWPVNLESFGDYKPALYAYILIPFIKVMGLTELAVRLPSALAGIFSVLLIYLLTKEIFENSEIKNSIQISNFKFQIEHIAALFLAISPWHLHFSRGAWEVNLATMFILAGVYFFLRWLKSPKLLYIELCSLNFVLSMYTYQSARVIAPLLGIGLGLLYFKNLFIQRKQILIASVSMTLVLLPLVSSLITSGAYSRLSGVGLLADEGPLNRVKELRGQHSDLSSLSGKLLHNRPVIYTIRFINNYLDHFSGNFLFIKGDEIPRSKVPETGLLYLTDFVLLAFGFFYLIRSPWGHSRIVWLWLFISPVAAAITFQSPHALRAQNMVIPLTILLAVGVSYIFNCFSKYKSFILFILLILYSYNLSRYLHQYYVHYPQEYPFAWEYGFKEMVPYVESEKNRYDTVYITDKYDQPYIIYLFYSRYPPQKFQGEHELTFRDKYNFSTVRQFADFRFENTPWDKVRDIHPSLIVAAPEDIPDVGVNIVKTIYFPGGSPAFKIVSN